MLMLDIALRELSSHKVRTALTAVGIFIAITAIVSLGSISAGVNELVTSSTSGIGSDTIFVMREFDMSQMSGPPSSGGFSITDLTSEEVETISTVSGVTRVVPVISRQLGGFTEVDGINMDDVDIFGAKDMEFKEGNWPENGNMEAVLGYVAANMLGVAVGDYINLNGKEVEVVGIFEEGSGAYDLVILIPYDVANDIYDVEGGATQVMIEPQDISAVDDIKQSIEEELDGVSAMTMQDALSMMQDMTLTLNVMTFGIGFVASLVAAIGIVITMYTSVLERKRQIGIMKATGALGRAIMKQVMEEALIISVASSILGVFVSFFMVEIINEVLLGGTRLAVVTPVLAGGAVAYGVVLTMLAALYPSWVAIKVDPIKAIREG